MAWFSPKELQQRVLASFKPVLSDLQFFACGEQQAHKAQVSSLNCEIGTEASFLLTMVPWLFGVVIFLLLVIMTLLAYLIWFVKTKEESSELKKLLKELSKSNAETIFTDKNSDNNEAGRLLPDSPDSNSQIGKDSGKQTKIPSFPALTTCGRVQSKMYEQTSGDDETETEKLIESKNFEMLPNNDQEFEVLSPVENLISKD